MMKLCVSLLADCPRLRALQLAGCDLGCDGATAILSASAAAACSLTAIDLSDCGIKDFHDAEKDAAAAAVALPAGVSSVMIALASAGSSLQRLNLAGNALGPQSASAVATAVSARASRGCPLQVLGLGSTGLGDAICDALASPLAEGSLKLLDLSSCGITDVGLGRLARVLWASSCGLEELRLSGNCLLADGAEQGTAGAGELGRALAWRCCTAAADAAAIAAASVAPGSDEAHGFTGPELGAAARQAIPRVLELEGTSLEPAVAAARTAAGAEVEQTRAAIARGGVRVSSTGSEPGRLPVPPQAARAIATAAQAALACIGLQVPQREPWCHPQPRQPRSLSPAAGSDAGGGLSAIDRGQGEALAATLAELSQRVAAADSRAARAEERAEQAARLGEEVRASAAATAADLSAVSAAVDRLSARVGRVDSVAKQALAAVALPAAAEEGRALAEGGAGDSQSEQLDSDSPRRELAGDGGPSRIAAALGCVQADAAAAKRMAEEAHAAVRGVGTEALRAEVASLRERFAVLEEAVMREQADTIAALEAILSVQERTATDQ